MARSKRTQSRQRQTFGNYMTLLRHKPASQTVDATQECMSTGHRCNACVSSFVGLVNFNIICSPGPVTSGCLSSSYPITSCNDTDYFMARLKIKWNCNYLVSCTGVPRRGRPTPLTMVATVAACPIQAAPCHTGARERLCDRYLIRLVSERLRPRSF